MPKKSRRSKERKRAKQAQIARERGSQPAATAVVAPAAVAAPANAPPKMKISKAQDLALHYGHVMADLRLVGILTGIMVLILVILSFIIR